MIESKRLNDGDVAPERKCVTRGVIGGSPKLSDLERRSVGSNAHALTREDRPLRLSSYKQLGCGLRSVDAVVWLAEMSGPVHVPVVSLRVVRVGALCLQMSESDIHREGETYEQILQTCLNYSKRRLRVLRHLSALSLYRKTSVAYLHLQRHSTRGFSSSQMMICCS